MKIYFYTRRYLFLFLIVLSCDGKKDEAELQNELQSIKLTRGDIALCGSDEAKFGKVEFALSCKEKVRANFNLATALLHSFEYGEAEKVFAKVIDEDPECLMAYWGVAMSNFHPLWAPPIPDELKKGSKVITLARSLKSTSARESDYLEASAVLYDNWKDLDHKTRIRKFEKAAEQIHQKYPADNEAAIFYALALTAASDPSDKTFAKQKKAGEILNPIFSNQPDHPGIAHYLIHIYDSPELAELGLPAARKYASIASASAHALHMPSHIFTRLGLWDESVQSNINSMAAAKCYAENSGMQGHWDEELHGLDYLVYAYLQQARDDKAKEQLDYLSSIVSASPMNNKVAYTMAAVPTRYALERKDWHAAAALELKPNNFPWNEYPWERSIVSFGRLLGAIHLKKPDVVHTSLKELKANHDELVEQNKSYEANQVKIQIKSSEAWIAFSEGRREEAIRLMSEAADQEDATEKHPVTPGEVIPARELLADLYMELGQYPDAHKAYEEDLKRHAGRFNGLQGAGVAARKLGKEEDAKKYFQQIITAAQLSDMQRPALLEAKSFLKGKI
jgi:tetratricopeptide (TPR) repeat protein